MTKLRDKIKMKRCKYCKSKENLTVDHKVPIIQGGTNKTTNLQCLCLDCNRIKSGLSHKQVIRYFNWFLKIQKGRLAADKQPYTLK